MKRLSIVTGGLALVAALVVYSNPLVKAQQIGTITLPAPGTTKTLYEGCNNIALTFPDRTEVRHPHPGSTDQGVVDAIEIEPSSALQSISIWRYDAAQNRFQAFSSAVPQASDLLTVNFLDAVWICVTASAVGPGPTPMPTGTSQPGGFSVHFIDVGQGDAILVEAGDADILVDGGPSGPAVLSYLAGRVVPDIDLMVATHPHADHIGGLDDVLRQYDVREVWTNGATATGQTYQDFAAAVAAEGAVQHQVRRGYSTQFGGVTLTALDPVDPPDGRCQRRLHSASVSCGSVNVLLTGDAIDCSRNQYNCSDFSTCAEVMAVFNACPGDPNRLDGDHDGTPCESLCS